MIQLGELGVQVSLVDVVGGYLDRDALHNVESVTFQADHFLGVVGEKTNIANAKIHQNLSANAVPAQVGGKSQLFISLHRVQSGVLQLVGTQLVVQSYAPAFLTHIEKDASAVLLDHFQGFADLLAAVAAKAAEGVAGKALAVHSDQYGLVRGDVALDKSNVLFHVDSAFVCYSSKVPVYSGELGLSDTLDQGFVLLTIGHQLGDADYLDVVFL